MALEDGKESRVFGYIRYVEYHLMVYLILKFRRKKKKENFFAVQTMKKIEKM